jgi:hypothetical protein
MLVTIKESCAYGKAGETVEVAEKTGKKIIFSGYGYKGQPEEKPEPQEKPQEKPAKNKKSKK